VQGVKRDDEADDREEVDEEAEEAEEAENGEEEADEDGDEKEKRRCSEPRGLLLSVVAVDVLSSMPRSG
jgi:hypothetical protein